MPKCKNTCNCNFIIACRNVITTHLHEVTYVDTEFSNRLSVKSRNIAVMPHEIKKRLLSMIRTLCWEQWPHYKTIQEIKMKWHGALFVLYSQWHRQAVLQEPDNEIRDGKMTEDAEQQFNWIRKQRFLVFHGVYECVPTPALQSYLPAGEGTGEPVETLLATCGPQVALHRHHLCHRDFDCGVTPTCRRPVYWDQSWLAPLPWYGSWGHRVHWYT